MAIFKLLQQTLLVYTYTGALVFFILLLIEIFANELHPVGLQREFPLIYPRHQTTCTVLRAAEMTSFVPCLCWVPKSVSKEIPDKVSFSRWQSRSLYMMALEDAWQSVLLRACLGCLQQADTLCCYSSDHPVVSDMGYIRVVSVTWLASTHM